MVNRTSSIIIGAGVGALAGWVVGNIVADIVAPEFYTEEERKNYAEQMKQWDYEAATTKIMEGKPGKEPGDKVDYTQFNKKQPLGELVNEIDNPEEETPITKDGKPITEEDGEISYEAYVELFDEDDIRLMSQKEFVEDDGIVEQTTLHYYLDDETLTDDQDQPLQVDASKLIGEEALTEFGRFGEDPHAVHVWNPEKECEYKVILILGSYEQEVLGVDPALGAKETKVVRNVFDEAKEKEGDES